MKICFFVFLLVVMMPFAAHADSPKCDGPDNWAAGMAYSDLKNSGDLTPETVDFSKTKVDRIASEKIGSDLYRQVHEIIFVKKSGEKLSVITVNDASHDECSMSGVKMFIITREFGSLKE